MAKYIELIDKYRIVQTDGTDYNPPSYVWEDNTGEIVRCGECKWWHDALQWSMYSEGMDTSSDWFCADGEREVQE